MEALRPLKWSEPALPETRIFNIFFVRTSNLTAEDVQQNVTVLLLSQQHVLLHQAVLSEMFNFATWKFINIVILRYPWGFYRIQICS